jgi:hypothetical protein
MNIFYIFCALSAAAAGCRNLARAPFWRLNMCVQPPPQTTKILINARPGGFLLSEKFYTEFEAKYNHSLKNYPYFFPITNLNSYNITMSIERGMNMRYDERVINLFENLGATESSYILSNIIVKEVPTEIIPYITIHQAFGQEYLLVHTSKMYKDLLKKIINARYIMHNDVLELYRINELERNLTAAGYTCV